MGVAVRLIRGCWMAAVLVTFLILAACGSTPRATVAPPLPRSGHPPRTSLSDAVVCAAFNRMASPTMHPLASYASFAKLAAQARDAEIRRAAEALVRESRHDPIFDATGSKDFSEIGTACVAKGLTPKYWMELA